MNFRFCFHSKFIIKNYYFTLLNSAQVLFVPVLLTTKLRCLNYFYLFYSDTWHKKSNTFFPVVRVSYTHELYMSCVAYWTNFVESKLYVITYINGNSLRLMLERNLET